MPFSTLAYNKPFDPLHTPPLQKQFVLRFARDQKQIHSLLQHPNNTEYQMPDSYTILSPYITLSLTPFFIPQEYSNIISNFFRQYNNKDLLYKGLNNNLTVKLYTFQNIYN